MAITIKDVAREAKVSIATVSHVINNSRYVSDDLRSRVSEAIKLLGYQPNPWGRSLRKDQSDMIALVLPDQSNMFFHKIARGVEEQARMHGYSLLYCNTNEEPELEKFYIGLFAQKRADGFIVASTEDGATNLRELASTDVPLVLVDRKLDGLRVPQVVSDNEEGAFQAMAHLLQLGHKRIGILSGLADLSTTRERLLGIERALSAFSLPLNPELIASGFSETEESYAAAECLLTKQKISALFCTNNKMTIGALSYITEAGIKYPDELSVVGYDDGEWATLVTPRLTLVEQKPYEMGYQAGQILFEQLASSQVTPAPKTLSLPTQLIIRESTCISRMGT